MKNKSLNYDDDRKIAAQRLRNAMHEAGIKPSELAEKTGLSRGAISQYRNGTYIPSNISAEKMGKVLGVHPLWLMGFSEDYLPGDYILNISTSSSSNTELLIEKGMKPAPPKLDNVFKSYIDKFIAEYPHTMELIKAAKDASPEDITLVTEMLKKLNRAKED